MYFQAQCKNISLQEDDNVDFEQEDGYDIGIDLEVPLLQDHMNIQLWILLLSLMPLSCSAIPNTLKPPHIFLTSTITFHIANKVSLSMTVDKAATLWRPWSLSCDLEIFALCPAWYRPFHFRHLDSGHAVSTTILNNHIQIWYKLHMQQFLYHNKSRVDALQTICAYPPSNNHPHGLYDTVITSPGPEHGWPQKGLEGTIIILLSRLILY